MPYGQETVYDKDLVNLSKSQKDDAFLRELYNSMSHQFNSIKKEENEDKERDERASEISQRLIVEGEKKKEAQLDKNLDDRRAAWNVEITKKREQRLREQQLLLSTQGEQPGGFRHKKPSVPQSKEILGKIRRVYKVAGSRKEHIKYKGELIPVSDYKKLVSQAKALKSQNKPVTKPKAKPTAKSTTKSATKPKTKSKAK